MNTFSRFLLALLSLTLIMAFAGCPSPSSSDGSASTPSGSGGTTSTILTVTNAPANGTSVPKSFSFDIDYDIDDADWDNAAEYHIRAYFRGKNGSLVQIADSTVSVQTGSVTLTYSIDDAADVEFITENAESPYRLYFDLTSNDGGLWTVYYETNETVYNPGSYTGEYTGWIHSFGADGQDDDLNGGDDDGYTQFILRMAHFGDLVLGQMTTPANPDYDSSVADVIVIDATVDGAGDLNMDIDGLGTMISGGSAGTVYEGSGSLIGGHIFQCGAYNIQGDSAVRGDFDCYRLGEGTVSGTISIPAGQSTAIHNAMDGDKFQIGLLWSLTETPPENGCVRVTPEGSRPRWNDSDETYSFSFDNVADGTYYVEFLHFTSDTGGPDFTSGTCFGMAGMTGTEAITVLSDWESGTLDISTIPSFTVINGSVVSNADIEIGMIP